MSSILPSSDRMEDVTKESDDVMAQETQGFEVMATEEADEMLEPALEATTELAAITTTTTTTSSSSSSSSSSSTTLRHDADLSVVEDVNEAQLSTDHAAASVDSRSSDAPATSTTTDAVTVQSEQFVQPLQTQPISASTLDAAQPSMNTFESTDVTASTDLPVEDPAVLPTLSDTTNTQNIEVTPEMQSLFASVSLLDANGHAPGVTDMEMEVLEALIAAGSGVDGNEKNAMESMQGIESTADDMPMDDSSTGLVPPPKSSSSAGTPTIPLPLTATALASVPISSVPIPTPATPRASDPPIPIDHALTEPIAAFYKLQFYAGSGEGDEEEGFAYYMQTLDVMIGRKVVSVQWHLLDTVLRSLILR